jgi:hypothetical protein
MAVHTEGKHAGEFLVREFDPEHNREVGIVTSGQNLKAGHVVAIVADKLVAMPGTLATDGSLTAEAVGILWDNVNASSTGPLGAADIAGCPYIARGPAVVKASALTFPTETTEGDEQALVTAQLKALGIIVR